MRSRLTAGWFSAALLLFVLSPRLDADTIEGQVVHPERPEETAELLVLLRGLKRSGETIERETRTDAGGHYRFEKLPQNAAYLLSAEFAGIPFSGGVITFEAGAAGSTQSRDIPVYDASNDPGEVSIAHSQWVVRREAGTYRMQQRVKIQNLSTRVIQVAPEDAPAIRIGIAARNGRVVTPFGPVPDGIEVTDTSLELRGPIYPGEQDYTFLYDLASAIESDGTPRTLDTTIAVPDPIREVDLFVQDFGVVVDAPALYASRPTRDGDVFYLRFVGFELDADRGVPLRVRPLPPYRAGSGLFQVAGLTLLAGALAWFVSVPFRSPAAAGPEDERGDEPNAALETALADLDHDFETGKLSTEDRDRLRADLESFHDSESPPAEPRDRELEPVETTCACGRVAAPGDRFCAACGRPL